MTSPSDCHVSNLGPKVFLEVKQKGSPTEVSFKGTKTLKEKKICNNQNLQTILGVSTSKENVRTIDFDLTMSV